MAVDEYPIDTVKVRQHRNFSVYVRVTIRWKSIVGGLRKPCSLGVTWHTGFCSSLGFARFEHHNAPKCAKMPT